MVRVSPEVSNALKAARPVVALESSVLSQGLPIPENREAAGRMMAAVRASGAIPALTAVLAGVPSVGVEDAALERLLRRDNVRKVSTKDLPSAVANRQDGATTVAAAIVLAALAGVTVFATGGIGGVHREAPFDESADLVELARTPVIVVCAGAKSILDLRATAERLETLGVPVVGFATSEWPGFYSARTGIPVAQRADSVAAVADLWRAQRELGLNRALVVLNPLPESETIDAGILEQVLAKARDRARHSGVTGAALTPYLLMEVAGATGGRALRANLALLEGNARLAGAIAVALSA